MTATKTDFISELRDAIQQARKVWTEAPGAYHQAARARCPELGSLLADVIAAHRTTQAQQ